MTTETKPVSMGTRGEDADVWCDVYSGRRPAPAVVMVHRTFQRRIDRSPVRVGGCPRCDGNDSAWVSDGATIRLVAAGTEYIYEATGIATAGGYIEYRWPD